MSINGKDVIVRKLPLKKYAELLGAFEELPKHLNLIDGKNNAEIVQNLPVLISTCYPDVVRVIKVATDMTDEEIDAMGLDDFIAVIEAASRINKFSEIYARIKKIIARPNAEPKAPEIGSGGQ